MVMCLANVREARARNGAGFPRETAMKYAMLSAAFVLVFAVVLYAEPQPTDDYSFDGYTQQ